MKFYIICFLMFLPYSQVLGSEEVSDKRSVRTGSGLSAEARKTRFESLQKELEASRPDVSPTREQVMAYLELAMDSYGTFARDNPQTAEGFEAASSVAAMLSQTRHPQAQQYAELAGNSAPTAGVDVKRVAVCWAMVADARLQQQDSTGARAALEKIKALDQEMYKQFSEQLNAAERQMAAKLQASEALQPGKKPFAIEEIGMDGKEVSLSAMKGKVVIIDFWAPWCGPCMNEMPNLTRLYKQQHANGLEILGVSLDNNEGELRAAVKENAMSWKIISDHGGWQNVIAKKWGVDSIPRTYVLDRKGIIRYVGLGGEQLTDAVSQLLNEKP